MQAGAQSYRSALHRATQKDLAKSRAAVDVLANMAGMRMPEIAEALVQDLTAGRKAREAGEPAEQAGRAGQAGEIAESGEADAGVAAAVTLRTGITGAPGTPAMQEVAEAVRDTDEETAQPGPSQTIAQPAGPGPESEMRSPAEPELAPPVQEEPRQNDNYKGRLQEQCAGARWERPVYREVSRSGPPHSPTFTVKGTLSINGVVYEEIGVGKTKGQAEQEAARCLLERIPSPEPQAQAPRSLSETRLQNAVGVLNEMAQRREIQSVEYAYEASGPPHALVFTCTCQLTRLDGVVTVHQAKGQTKKRAAQAAAKLAALTLLLAKER